MNDEILWKRKTKNIGLRMGDAITIKSIQGHDRTVFLNYTEYKIVSSGQYSTSVFGTNVRLSSLPEEEFSFESSLLDVEGEKVYTLTSRCGRPFQLNGAEVFKAILHRGDRLQIGENVIECVTKIQLEKREECRIVSEDIAKSKLIIYLEGETGTGKTHLAKKIHELSGRKGNFVHINLSAFGSGLIESELFGHVKGAFTGAIRPKLGAIEEANHGTLFLDEIDSIDESLQLKLLLFLDNYRYRQVGGNGDRAVDVRVIIASGRKLEDLVKQGKVRKDFYYRVMSGMSYHLEPLHKNRELINRLINEYEREYGVKFDEALVEFYRRQEWPGNIRQFLAHLDKKRVLTKGNFIEWTDADKVLHSPLKPTLPDTIITFKEMKFQYFFDVYNRLSKNIALTAKALKVSPATVKNVISEIEISAC